MAADLSLMTHQSFELYKAQPDNMPLLDACLEKNVRLVDYEMIAENNERKVAFGHWAGIAGAINGLSLLGTRLLRKGSYSSLEFQVKII